MLKNYKIINNNEVHSFRIAYVHVYYACDMQNIACNYFKEKKTYTYRMSQ